MDQKVVKVSAAQEESFKETNSYIPLNVFTLKAAAFANNVIHWAVSHLSFKERFTDCRRRYYTPDTFNPNHKKGGGCVATTSPTVVMNDLSEVAVHLCDRFALASYARSATTDAERFTVFKQKLAYNMKLYWRSMAAKKGVTEFALKLPARIDSKSSSEEAENVVGDVSYSEYRCFYELLMGRKIEKTVDKYGKFAYDNFIGKPVDDQFVITAVTTLQNEIANAEKECGKKIEELTAECEAKVKELRKQCEVACNLVRQAKNAKIEELKKQILAMTSMKDEQPGALKQAV